MILTRSSLIVALASIASLCRSFTLPYSPLQLRSSVHSSSRSSFPLSATNDKVEEKLETPPLNFYESLNQALKGCAKAFGSEEQHRLVEVEFPPLSVEDLEDPNLSADDLSRANTKLAFDFAERFAATKLSTILGRDLTEEEATRGQPLGENGEPIPNPDRTCQVAILYPDAAEARRSTEFILGTYATNRAYENIDAGRGEVGQFGDDGGAGGYGSGGVCVRDGMRVHSLRLSNFKTAQDFGELIGGLFGLTKGNYNPSKWADIYIALVFSAQELPDLRQLAEEQPDKPIIFFNLKLDTQRGDLGLLGFPPKDLHYEFLAKIKPTYLLRSRVYSLSLLRPPYFVSYQGALFRVYPQPYQALLDTGRGAYRLVEKLDQRPPLGVFKDVITEAVEDSLRRQERGEDNAAATSGDKAATAMRRGVKNKTWWEDEKNFPNEKSQNWRT